MGTRNDVQDVRCVKGSRMGKRDDVQDARYVKGARVQGWASMSMLRRYGVSRAQERVCVMILRGEISECRLLGRVYMTLIDQINLFILFCNKKSISKTDRGM